MKKIFSYNNAGVLVLFFILSRVLVTFAGIGMDQTALYRYWQYLDVFTLQHHLLRGVWYDHTQPPIFNLFLGSVLKMAGTHAPIAFQTIFKIFTLANAWLLLTILKKVTRHTYLPLLLSLLYLLSPATIIFENELFYTSFITLLLLISVRSLLYLEDHITWRHAAGLFIPLVLVCLTRSMYHIIWLLVLSVLVCIWHRKKDNARPLFLGSLLSFLLVGSWYVKNYFIFHELSTSTWMGMNMARNVFHDATVTDSSNIAAIEPFSKISTYRRFLSPGYGDRYTGLNDRDLLQEWKNDSFINEKHVGYIAISHLYSEASQKAIRSHPAAYLTNVLQSAIIFFAPATRYPTTEYLSQKMAWYDVVYSFNLSHFAHGKQQRRIALTLSAIPKLVIYFLVFGWLVREVIRRRTVPGGLITVFITCVIAYIFLVSSLFEHYENMRFRYEVEPLFLILLAICIIPILDIFLPHDRVKVQDLREYGK
jgi:hypothetical protein